MAPNPPFSSRLAPSAHGLDPWGKRGSRAVDAVVAALAARFRGCQKIQPARHSPARASPASPESKNTDSEHSGKAGVFGFWARPCGRPRNDGTRFDQFEDSLFREHDEDRRRVPSVIFAPLVFRFIYTIHQKMKPPCSIPLHRRKPVPTAEVDPGFRRESEERASAQSSECAIALGLLR
jgi:hypothetical protein